MFGPLATVDWEATGSMMQGWGGLAAAAAVVYAARKAADTFKAFRRQKSEDKRIEAAERVLALAYRLLDDMAELQASNASSSELKEAKAQLKVDGLNPNSIGTLASADALKARLILDRVGVRHRDWSDVANLKAMARTYFEGDVEDSLSSIWDYRTALIAAAQELATPFGQRAASIPSWDDRFGHKTWTGATSPMYAASHRLESALLPIIRQSYEQQPFGV